MSRIESLEPRRLLTVLQPDVTWGDDGYVDRDVSYDYVGTVAAGVIVSTPLDAAYQYIARITRFTADGDADPRFADIVPDGHATAALDAAGRIYVLTNGGKKGVRVARYSPDGRPDDTWGKDGGVTLPLDGAIVTSDAAINRVALTRDGDLYLTVATGHDYYTDTGDTLVYKFDDRGKADRHFADRGVLTFAADPPSYRDDDDDGESDDADYRLFDWTGVQPDGRLVVVEARYASTVVSRYSADGRPDPTYGTGPDGAGAAIGADLTESDSLALDAEGRLIVAKLTTTYGEPNVNTFTVTRFTADGVLDGGFADGGRFTRSNNAEFADAPGHVLPQANGKLLVVLDDVIVRLTAAGRPDRSFGRNGLNDLGITYTNVVGQLRDGTLIADAPFEKDSTNTYSVARLTPRKAAARGDSGTLYVNGTNHDEDIRLRAASGGRVAVEFDGAVIATFRRINNVVASLSAGNDTYVDDYFTGPDVPTFLYADYGNKDIATGGGDDSINCGEGDDTVHSGDGTDDLFLYTGNATVDAGSGGGRIEARAFGDQTCFVRGDGGDWRVIVDGGRADVALTGTSANVTLDTTLPSTVNVDTTGPATVDGGEGDDSIVTGDGDDNIYPAGGNDTVRTGNGNDTVHGLDRFDEPGDGSDDLIDLGPGDDRAVDGDGSNTILGGDGDDSIRTGDGDDSLVGGAGRDTLRAGAGRDTLAGNGGRDRLFGYDGNDLISGGNGDDTLAGGPGDDTLYGGPGEDVLQND